MDGEIRLRPAASHDLAAVLALVPRLHAEALPSWRSAAVQNEGKGRVLTQAILAPDDGVEVLVAESGGEGQVIGFVHLTRSSDPVTSEAHGHIGNLVVSEAAEGCGVGEALVRAAEAWTRARGWRRLTLGVFAGNARARALYARLGYEIDTLRLVKVLEADGVVGE